MYVFILLYNPGTKEEKIHTIQRGRRQKVLMFESEVSATYFSCMLERQRFPKPTPRLINSEQVIQFCLNSGYDWEIIRTDKVAIPPTGSALKNVDVKRVKKNQLQNLARIKTTYLPRTRNTVISKTPSLNLGLPKTSYSNIGMPNQPVRPLRKPLWMQDSDNDGVPNYMDRYPFDPTRH